MLPIKKHASEGLNYFNSWCCDAVMLISTEILPFEW